MILMLCSDSIFDVCCVRCGYQAGTESQKVFYVKTILERAFHHGLNPAGPLRAWHGLSLDCTILRRSFLLCTKYPTETQTCSTGSR